MYSTSSIHCLCFVERHNTSVFSVIIFILARSHAAEKWSSACTCWEALDRFSAACDRTRMKIITKNTEVLCLSTKQRQCMLQVSGIHWAGGEIQVNRVVFTSDGMWSKEADGLIKQMQFCVSFIDLWSQNGSFQTSQSCQFLNRLLFRSLPVILNLG